MNKIHEFHDLPFLPERVKIVEKLVANFYQKKEKKLFT